MLKFGIYTLVCFANMVICARAGMKSGEGVLQWFLILMAMINLFMLFSPGGGPAGRVQSSRLRVISGEKHENDR